MFERKKIKTGSGPVDAFLVSLLSKNLILFKGRKGYIMCGYLNLSAASKAGDVAAKIKGVTTIEEALRAKIHSCTGKANKAGIYIGQPVKEALALLA